MHRHAVGWRMLFEVEPEGLHFFPHGAAVEVRERERGDRQAAVRADQTPDEQGRLPQSAADLLDVFVGDLVPFHDRRRAELELQLGTERLKASGESFGVGLDQRDEGIDDRRIEAVVLLEVPGVFVELFAFELLLFEGVEIETRVQILRVGGDATGQGRAGERDDVLDPGLVLEVPGDVMEILQGRATQDVVGLHEQDHDPVGAAEVLFEALGVPQPAVVPFIGRDEVLDGRVHLDAWDLSRQQRGRHRQHTQHERPTGRHQTCEPVQQTIISRSPGTRPCVGCSA